MRGVSSIIVLILILLIAVSLATMLYFYLTGTQEDITGLIERQQEIEAKKIASEMKILGYDPNSGNITIRNTGRFDLTNFNLFLNGLQTDIHTITKLSPGEIGVIAPVVKPGFGGHTVKITASYAEAQGFLIIPGGPYPFWSLLAQNGTIGYTAEFSCYWVDDVMLSHAILSTNETGSWLNRTATSLGAMYGWTNYTWSNASLSDYDVVAWRIYVNDSDDNWNTTTIKLFTIGPQPSDTEPPKWFSVGENATSGEAFESYAYWTDNVSLSHATLSECVTPATIGGCWVNKSTISLSGSAAWSNFTWSDTSGYANGEIDLEFSRWGDPGAPNAQYVVQPYHWPGHLMEFYLLN